MGTWEKKRWEKEGEREGRKRGEKERGWVLFSPSPFSLHSSLLLSHFSAFFFLSPSFYLSLGPHQVETRNERERERKAKGWKRKVREERYIESAYKLRGAILSLSLSLSRPAIHLRSSHQPDLSTQYSFSLLLFQDFFRSLFLTNNKIILFFFVHFLSDRLIFSLLPCLFFLSPSFFSFFPSFF